MVGSRRDAWSCVLELRMLKHDDFSTAVETPHSKNPLTGLHWTPDWIPSIVEHSNHNGKGQMSFVFALVLMVCDMGLDWDLRFELRKSVQRKRLTGS